MANYVLEILDGDRAGDTVPVTEQPLRIGRKPVNDLVLSDEKTSGVHCEIVLEGDRHVLRDLGSTNGTFIDGRRVTEVVLTAGDAITVGRVALRFRDESAQQGGGADFAVHRLDASRLQKRGGAVVWIAAVAVLAAAGGGYWWWQDQPQADPDGTHVVASKAPLFVPGNKLSAAVASCDDPEAWVLGALGSAFVPTGSAHSGRGALEASRLEGGEAPDYAVATLAQPVAVVSGRSLTLAAHVRTLGKAKVGIRGVCWSSDENNVLRFRHGSPLQAADGWTRITAELAVPPGYDRLDIELVALLADPDGAAIVDDVAVTEAGDATALDHTMEEGAQRLVGTGTALAVRSTEVSMLRILPASVPVELRALAAAGLAALSDVGAGLQVTPAARSVALEVSGADGIAFCFPAASAGQTIARTTADGPFAPLAAASENTLTDLLLGGGATRMMLHFAEPAVCRGSVAGGIYRLEVGATAVELVLGFNAERRRALELLRSAQEEERQGQPGRALDRIRALQQTVPHHSGTFAQAAALRSEIIGRLDDSLTQLRRELEQARYFDTRGGFARVQSGVDQLLADYGEQNMEGRDYAELRASATERLSELDGAQQAATEQRLDLLTEAFREAGLQGLAGLVAGYKQRHLGR